MKNEILFLRERLNQNFHTLVKDWFPNGKLHGQNEYVVINTSRPNSSLGSFSINLEKKFGYDFASRQFFDVIALYALSHSISNRAAITSLMGKFPPDGHSAAAQPPLNSIEPWPRKPNIPAGPFRTDRLRHRHWGRPEMVFEYRDSEDALIGYTARFVRTSDHETEKVVLPMSWNVEEHGAHWSWNERGWNGVKPISGAEKLRLRPTQPILLVEGEKTCAAAERMFPEFVCISWRGGVGSVSRVDWSLLATRVIAVWPDNDQPGMVAANCIATVLPNVEVIPAPHWKPKAWDLADAEYEGVPVDLLRNYIKRHASRLSLPLT
jgi:hypothetical protein